MDEIFALKTKAAQHGWTVEEKISKDGWKDTVGYVIWLKRSDWHGKLTYSVTGQQVVFVGLARNACDEQEVQKAVKEVVDMAIAAWRDFPDSIPCQTTQGIQKAKEVVSFREGKNI